MKNRAFFQKMGAYLMLFGFLAAFGLREVHHLFAHCHDEKQTCRDARPGESHLHDEHFNIHDCDLCGFVVSAAELPDFQWVAPKIESAFEARLTAPEARFSTFSAGILCLRGPPVASRFFR